MESKFQSYMEIDSDFIRDIKDKESSSIRKIHNALESSKIKDLATKRVELIRGIKVLYSERVLYPRISDGVPVRYIEFITDNMNVNCIHMIEGRYKILVDCNEKLKKVSDAMKLIYGELFRNDMILLESETKDIFECSKLLKCYFPCEYLKSLIGNRVILLDNDGDYKRISTISDASVFVDSSLYCVGVPIYGIRMDCSGYELPFETKDILKGIVRFIYEDDKHKNFLKQTLIYIFGNCFRDDMLIAESDVLK